MKSERAALVCNGSEMIISKEVIEKEAVITVLVSGKAEEPVRVPEDCGDALFNVIVTLAQTAGFEIDSARWSTNED